MIKNIDISNKSTEWSHLNVESKKQTKQKNLELIDTENRLVIARGGGLAYQKVQTKVWEPLGCTYSVVVIFKIFYYVFENCQENRYFFYPSKVIHLFIGFLFYLLFLGSCFAACGILVTSQGLNPCTLYWEHRVLTTGLPGTSLVFYFEYRNIYVCTH